MAERLDLSLLSHVPHPNVKSDVHLQFISNTPAKQQLIYVNKQSAGSCLYNSTFSHPF